MVTPSMGRILTTHVGALQRPAELVGLLVPKPEDPTAASEPLRAAVADVVRKHLRDRAAHRLRPEAL